MASMSGPMSTYTMPQLDRAALITIDVQTDVLDDQPLEIARSGERRRRACRGAARRAPRRPGRGAVAARRAAGHRRERGRDLQAALGRLLPDAPASAPEHTGREHARILRGQLPQLPAHLDL